MSSSSKQHQQSNVPDFPVSNQATRQVRKALTSSSNPYETISNFQQSHSLHSFLSKAFGTTSIYSLANHSGSRTSSSISSTTGGGITTSSSSGTKRITRSDIEIKNNQLSQGVVVEPFQPDSVLQFLHHLGVSRYDIHKKICDALRDKLESEIQKIDLKGTSSRNGREALLELLKSTWEYIHVPELRPVFVTLIKKLGDQTPKELLVLLAKKDSSSTSSTTSVNGVVSNNNNTSNEDVHCNLKYAELLDQFSLSMKRLIWEADWSNVVRGDGQLVTTPDGSNGTQTTTIGTLHSSNVLSDIVYPIVKAYVMDTNLRKAADLAFTTSFSDRKMDTLKRRKIITSSDSGTMHTVTTSVLTGTLSSLTSKGLVKSNKTTANSCNNSNVENTSMTKPSNTNTTTTIVAAATDTNNTGLALAKLKEVMGLNAKLLSAVLNMLIAEHGSRLKTQPSNSDSTTTSNNMINNNAVQMSILGGSSFLHCTLVSDIILSYGQLPKQYEFVQVLAQILDDSVKKGLISDQALAQIQGCLRSIFQSSSTVTTIEIESKSNNSTTVTNIDKPHSAIDDSARDASDKQFELKLLRKLIKLAVARMKENDIQRCFLNPVTDDIAPGYSQIIQKPICLSEIEKKAIDLQYTSLNGFESDVKLMFSNCTRYNTGTAGKWFRDEARRQQKKWRESIMKSCKDMYVLEMNRRKNVHDIADENALPKIDEAERIRAQQQNLSKKLAESKRGGEKRKIQNISDRNDKSITGLLAEDVNPLPKSRGKKRKTDMDFPSMPALASMILSDPLVVRLLVFKVLNAIKNDILKSNDIPANHKTVPSIMQLLYIVQNSMMLCSKKGKLYVVPDVGLTKSTDGSSDETDSGISEYIALRKYTALLAKLILEATVDQRFCIGGDFYSHLSSSSRGEVETKEWVPKDSSSASLLLPLVQGALIPFLKPNASNEMSLLVQLPRFFLAIDALSKGNMVHEKPFYVSLVETILKHKSKLPHSVRDLIVKHWLKWFKSSDGSSSMTGAVHVYFIKLLNEWSTFGNLILPLNSLLQFSENAVLAAQANEADEMMTFAYCWNNNKLGDVQEEYERLLRNLPEERCLKWKQVVGLQ